MERTKGGLNTKLHLAVDAHGMPVKMIITGGTTADCTMAHALIEGLSAKPSRAGSGDPCRQLWRHLPYSYHYK